MQHRIIVTYRNCAASNDGLPESFCKVEQFQEFGKIVGYGKVLNKCIRHSEVLDEELVEVLRAEGKAINIAARKAAIEGRKFSFRFEGLGKSRRLVEE